MMKTITTLAHYTILESLRNKMSIIAVFFFFFSFLMAEFIGALVLGEAEVFQSTLVAAMMRLVAVIMLSLFVIGVCLREKQEKQMEIILALPIHRYEYFFGKISGFFVIAFFLSLLFSVPVWAYSNYQSALIWGASLFCELMITTTIAFFLIFTFQYLVPAFIAFLGFYLAARMMNTLQFLAANPLDTFSKSDHFMKAFIQGLNFILPNLDPFCQSQWLTQTPNFSILALIFSETFIFVALLTMASLIDLYRKNL